MAVETLAVNAQFAGDGVTTSFPFNFPVQLASDVVVVLYTASGQVVQFPPTGFAVQLNPGDPAAGGTVAFTPYGAPAPVGSTVVVARYVPPLQSVDINNQGGFSPDVITDEFDRLVMVDQQLTDGVARAITLPPGDLATGTMQLPPAAQRANLVVGFDGNGNLICVEPGSSSGGGSGGGPTVPVGATLLGSSAAGSIVSVGLGQGLTETNGVLSASAANLPANSALLGTDSESNALQVSLGAGLTMSTGTLTLNSAQVPANAALLSSVNATLTGLLLGAGLSSAGGTLSAAAAALPFSAPLLGTNAQGQAVQINIGARFTISNNQLNINSPSLAPLLNTDVNGLFEPVALGAGLSVVGQAAGKGGGGTLTLSVNAPPANAPLLGTGSAGVLEAVALGQGLGLNNGTLTAAASTVPANAAILGSNAGGTLTALVLGAGLSDAGGTLTASAAALPDSAPLLSTNSGGTATALQLGPGVATTGGTLTVAAATLPSNAALLATSSAGSATAVVLGAGLSESGGTLTAAAAVVPPNAALLSSNAGGTLEALTLGAGVSAAGGTLSFAGGAIPANAALLGSNSGGTPTAITLGAGLTESGGTLAIAVNSLPASAPLLATTSSGIAEPVVVGAGLALAGGTLSASGGGAMLPDNAPLIGSNAGGTGTAVALGSGLALSGGTLTASGLALPANAQLLGSNAGGTGTAIALGSGLALSSGGTLSATGGSGGGFSAGPVFGVNPFVRPDESTFTLSNQGTATPSGSNTLTQTSGGPLSFSCGLNGSDQSLAYYAQDISGRSSTFTITALGEATPLYQPAGGAPGSFPIVLVTDAFVFAFGFVQNGANVELAVLTYTAASLNGPVSRWSVNTQGRVGWFRAIVNPSSSGNIIFQYSTNGINWISSTTFTKQFYNWTVFSAAGAGNDGFTYYGGWGGQPGSIFTDIWNWQLG